jgi:hypothetical protein
MPHSLCPSLKSQRHHLSCGEHSLHSPLLPHVLESYEFGHADVHDSRSQWLQPRGSRPVRVTPYASLMLRITVFQFTADRIRGLGDPQLLWMADTPAFTVARRRPIGLASPSGNNLRRN